MFSLWLVLNSAALSLSVRSDPERMLVVNDSNAVPGSLNMTTEMTAAACEALCASQAACLQWTWNTRSRHCLRSSSGTWNPAYSDHCFSGCRPGLVVGCGTRSHPPLLPSWTATRPDKSQPLAGYDSLPVAFKTSVHRGEPGYGSYNHNVFIDYQVDTGFVILWKNGPRDEDSNGQRILYSRSADGRTWRPAAELFPPLPNSTQEPGPFVHLGSRLFAACSPGIYNMSHAGKITDQDAQGSQFCLWPDPIDPRNCGPPDQRGVWGAMVGQHTLLMREILPNGKLGEMFWASGNGPSRYRSVNERVGIRFLSQMDSTTQKLVGGLRATMHAPCPDRDAGTRKCEACEGGCQEYTAMGICGTEKCNMDHERTHYRLPGQNTSDVLLYRQGLYLFASTRINSTRKADWPLVSATDIPNDSSNLNAGELPDGRIFLVHNPGSWNTPHDPTSVKHLHNIYH